VFGLDLQCRNRVGSYAASIFSENMLQGFGLIYSVEKEEEVMRRVWRLIYSGGKCGTSIWTDLQCLQRGGKYAASNPG
jgi:hypothetical protein